MTGEETSHFTVSYRDGRAEVTCIYAINEEILRDLRQRNWLGRRIRNRAGKDLRAWLESKGCLLDSSEGPAFAMRNTDGSIQEAHYRAGKLHRENGPAIVRQAAADWSVEEYYRDGKRHREDGPAVIKRYANGSTKELYYRNGEWFSSGGSCAKLWQPTLRLVDDC
jgi:hypothetical protein